MKHKYYLFDMDGTLVNSMPYIANLLIGFLNDRKVKYPDNILDILIPMGYKKVSEYYVNELKINENAMDVLKYMYETLRLSYENDIPLKEGVKEYLLSLKEKGYSLNVLSGSPHPSMDPCLKRNGIFELFDNTWCCEDFNTSKTDPSLYKMVAKKLGCEPSEIAFFDDNINSIKGGKSAGLYTVGVFDEAGKGFKSEMLEVTNKYINSFLEATEV